jgi:hypothetical protein
MHDNEINALRAGNATRADAKIGNGREELQSIKDDLVETVARIIDPSKWAVLDSYLADMLRKYKGEHIGYDPEPFKDKASMAKAQAAIAAVFDALDI